MKPKYLYFVFCLFLLNLACRSQRNPIVLTLRVDVTPILDQLQDPNSVGVLGEGPLLARYKRKLMKRNGNIYAIRLTVPDTLIGRRLTYAFVVDTFNLENRGYHYRQILLPERSTVLPVALFNDLVGTTGEHILPSPPMPVRQTNTSEEAAVLAQPYTGITTNGQARENLFSIRSTGFPTQDIQQAAESLLTAFTPEQRSQSTFGIEDKEWHKWHNIETYRRQGIGLYEMSEVQRELTFQLLAASLSPRGLQKTRDIMAMEDYLKLLSIRSGEVGSNRTDLIGHDRYHLTFMGQPSATEPWGWQLDGHHLAINYFILGDQVVMTPTFMGSEPNYIEEGPDQGIRTFEQEEKLGWELYRSLNESQRSRTTLLDRKLYNFAQTEAFKDNRTLPYVGIPAGELNSRQQEQLLTLTREYVGNMREEHAGVKMEEVEAHLEETWFSWVGEARDDAPFYYRIHSPVILIEFDHQGPVFLWDRKRLYPGPVRKHIHTVVRTPNGNDYGKDLLRQHLETHHKHE
ncbi:DUF3500 domain-containing protein [Flavilitoribacter nigricans]|uniref:DUF3500 domain-containing protein n=1 Tax=Flavilitoribacter nigricans (strain ATCC 23147 / DSM 23189 / NBRC 102662 / NCIMB 1420 / SS-2) TaxID=1122177 RepID=A0A2D0N128_FLAN2|nr:DUF3500 domain-containing protein [Flavilitoribacter nigricans]PHN02167.1 hypothetical protein CRP01_33805 [Flavilitoribacter nigricans DSM 23189 = NBRC 102662]